MNRKLRIAIVFGGAFLLLLSLLTVALKTLFPAARMRNAVQSEVRRRYGREIETGGVTIHPFGVRMQRLKVSERPAFAAGTFLYVEDAEARWSVWQLLRGRIVLKEVRLARPQITIVRYSDGRGTNISDLLGRSVRSSTMTAVQATTDAPPPRSVGGASTPPPGRPWQIGRIRLEHGLLQFNDRAPAGQSTSVADIHLELRDLRAGRMTGTLKVDRLENTVFKAQEFEASWQLTGLDRGVAGLSGSARFRQGPGTIENLGAVLASGRSTKSLLLPLMVLQRIDRNARSLRTLPVDRIVGEYRFDAGALHIKEFRAEGTVLNLSAFGYWDMVSGRLAVELSFEAPKNSPFGELVGDLEVGGTLARPVVTVRSLKKKGVNADVSRFIHKR